MKEALLGGFLIAIWIFGTAYVFDIYSSRKSKKKEYPWPKEILPVPSYTIEEIRPLYWSVWKSIDVVRSRAGNSRPKYEDWEQCIAIVHNLKAAMYKALCASTPNMTDADDFAFRICLSSIGKVLLYPLFGRKEDPSVLYPILKSPDVFCDVKFLSTNYRGDKPGAIEAVIKTMKKLDWEKIDATMSAEVNDSTGEMYEEYVIWFKYRY